MILEEKFTRPTAAAEIAKIKQIAADLGTDPNYLAAIMWHESGFNPKAVNWQQGDPQDPAARVSYRATGWIQFMPQTAIALGTTTTALYNMDALTQLDWVKKYYLPYKGKLNTFFDVTLATFFPAAMGKPDSYVFAQYIVNANAAMFATGPTMGDYKNYLRKKFAAYPELFENSKKKPTL
jgi:hypothetical protein